MHTKHNIPHLEDLPTKQFLNCIKNIDKFAVSEKLDGYQLTFGFDENKNFFTSRESKGGIRYYTESDYPREFWTEAFRGVHLALESWKNELSSVMEQNSLVEVEVLYGDCPNIIPYNPDQINRIVILRNIEGSTDLTKLKKKIRETCVVEVADVPYTKGGWDRQKKNVSQAWKMESVSYFSTLKYPAEEINPVMLQLEEFLQNRNTAGLVFEDLAKTKITKANKEEITNIRDQIATYKKAIKNILTKKLLRNQTSSFGPSAEKGGWIEGLVFQESNGFQFKLVDKEKFTKINKHQHHIQNEVRQKYWKDVKKDLREACNLKQQKLDESQKFLDDLTPHATSLKLTTNFRDVKTKMGTTLRLAETSMISDLQTLRLKMEYINSRNIDRILQEFQSNLTRVREMRSELSKATCLEHLIELALHQEISLPHHKSLYENCSSIKKEQIEETLNYIAGVTGIPKEEIAKNILGSTGKQAISNDIDICVDQSKYNIKEMEQKLQNNGIKTNMAHGLHILQMAVPIAGKIENGFVQTDLMFAENVDWIRFFYTSNPQESAYKGAYRNILLRALAASGNQTGIDENGELVERRGYVLVQNIGMVEQVRERPYGLKGNRLKNFVVKETLSTVSQPNSVLRLFFQGEYVYPKDVDTFEKLWKLINENFSGKRVELVKEIMIKILSEVKYKIPKEFFQCHMNS
jgi:DNA-binding transcriptional MerR regulator